MVKRSELESKQLLTNIRRSTFSVPSCCDDKACYQAPTNNLDDISLDNGCWTSNNWINCMNSATNSNIFSFSSRVPAVQQIINCQNAQLGLGLGLGLGIPFLLFIGFTIYCIKRNNKKKQEAENEESQVDERVADSPILSIDDSEEKEV